VGVLVFGAGGILVAVVGKSGLQVMMMMMMMMYAGGGQPSLIRMLEILLDCLFSPLRLTGTTDVTTHGSSRHKIPSI